MFLGQLGALATFRHGGKWSVVVEAVVGRVFLVFPLDIHQCFVVLHLSLYIHSLRFTEEDRWLNPVQILNVFLLQFKCFFYFFLGKKACMRLQREVNIILSSVQICTANDPIHISLAIICMRICNSRVLEFTQLFKFPYNIAAFIFSSLAILLSLVVRIVASIFFFSKEDDSKYKHHSQIPSIILVTKYFCNY